jgi:hypothetical protein
MTLPVFGNCRRAVGERHDAPALQQPDQAGRVCSLIVGHLRGMSGNLTFERFGV